MGKRICKRVEKTYFCRIIVKKKMRKGIIYTILTLMLVCSCGEDRTYEYLELTQENQWIYSCMKDNYLWNDSILTPKRQDFFAAGNKFFSSLLQKQDRFSHFNDSARNTSYGINYTLMRDPLGKQGRNYYALVRFVEPGSPAALAGLKRGDWISKIGRSNLSTSNMAIIERGTATTIYTSRIVLDEEKMEHIWQAADTIQIESATELSPTGIYLDTIYTQRNSRIGYIVCNRFTEESVDKMTSIAERFRQQQTTDLIIDLRYNSGGSLGAAGKVASMLVPSENDGRTFCTLAYNSLNSHKDTLYTYSTTNTLALKKAYIICGADTRGAAEVFMDAMRNALGYNNVTIVGETTYGEDVATEKFEWAYNLSISPAVAYICNAEGERTLLYGITPGYTINEFADIYKIYALGNKQEYMLYNTLYHIATGTFPQETAKTATATLQHSTVHLKSIEK